MLQRRAHRRESPDIAFTTSDWSLELFESLFAQKQRRHYDATAITGYNRVDNHHVVLVPSL